MTGKTDENKLINRYLLGELSEDELAQIEEKYFADEDFFARILNAENSLVDSYARGDFSAVERGKFEKQFLTTPQRRQKVMFARSLQKAIVDLPTVAATNVTARENERAVVNRGISLWQSLAGIFNIQNPMLGFGMAAVLLLIIGAGLVSVLLRSTNSSEIAKQKSMASNQTTLKSNEQPNNNLDLPNRNQSSNTTASSAQSSANSQARQLPTQPQTRNEKQSGEMTVQPKKQIDDTKQSPEKSNLPQPKSLIATFLLTPGLVRAEGERTQITIPPQAKQIRLQLSFEEDEYPRYRATVQNPDGAEVWSGRVRKTNKESKSVTLLVPAKTLSKGDYRLILKGETAEGELETAGEYPFSVVKK